MADFDLAQAMMALKRKGASGVLEVHAGDDDKCTSMGWSDGQIASARESTVSETLGRLLVRQRRMTQEQYMKVIDALSDRVSSQEDVRFGEVAIQLGVLTSEQVQAALQDQIRWRVVHALQWESSSWSFHQSQPDASAGEPFDVEPLFLLTARWVEPERLDAFLAPCGDEAPAIVASEDVGATFRLASDEAAFAASLDGTRSVRAILESWVENVDVRVVLTALLLGDACVLQTPMPAPPPKALAQTGRAKLARIATTKIRVVRQAAPPERTAPPSAPPPESSISREARLSGEQTFQSGQASLRRGDVAAALRQFKFAVQLCEDSVEYRLYAEWAEWLGGEHTDDRAASLLKTAHEATVQDPNLGFSRYVMGRLALRRGDRANAERLFQFAARLDPTLTGAVRLAEEAAKIEPRPGPAQSVVVSPVVVVSEPPPHGPEHALLALATHALAMSPEDSSDALAARPAAPSPSTQEVGSPAKLVPAAASSGSDVMSVSPADLQSIPPDAASEPGPPVKVATPPPLPSDLARPPEPLPSLPPIPVITPPSPARVSPSSSPARDSPAPPRSRAPWIIGLLLAGALGVFALLRTGTPGATSDTPTESLPPPPPAPATPPAPPTPTAAATVTAPPTAPSTAPSTPTARASAIPTTQAATLASVSAASSPSPPPADSGDLVIPSDVGTHRIWVDGKLVGEAPLTLRTKCGRHDVQVGSQGKVRSVDVRCGGTSTM